MKKVFIRHRGTGYHARGEGERLECSRPADTAGFSLPLLLFPFYFFGYIGAASGGLIIQASIALFAGGLFALKVYWRRIKGFFKRGKEQEEVQ